MKKSIKPSVIKGTLKAPASKSMMQRAIAASLLVDSSHTTTLSNLTYSNDSKAALSVIQQLGASITESGDQLVIRGGQDGSNHLLNCGESGLSIRMFTPIASLWKEELTLTGEGSLLSRPMSMIETPLKELGVQVTTRNGFLPVTVKGPLKGGTATVDGSISSQVLTGLLMALPKASSDSHITVNDLKSIPYIDMTLALLAHFNIKIRHQDYQRFEIKGHQSYRANSDQYTVEGDWSGAAFLLVAGAVGGSMTVTGLNQRSPQADRMVLKALKAAGAEVFQSEQQVTVRKQQLRRFDFDATHCPDLFPPLVALACHCTGTTVLHGVERLAHKESDRARVLEKEFNALGAQIRVNDDTMEIRGQSLKGGTIDSHNDHRIAMAGVIAAINAEKNVTVLNTGCVAKSYPAFFEEFIKIGGHVYE